MPGLIGSSRLCLWHVRNAHVLKAELDEVWSVCCILAVINVHQKLTQHFILSCEGKRLSDPFVISSLPSIFSFLLLQHPPSLLLYPPSHILEGRNSPKYNHSKTVWLSEYEIWFMPYNYYSVAFQGFRVNQNVSYAHVAGQAIASCEVSQKKSMVCWK